MDLYRSANEAEVQLIWWKRRPEGQFHAQEDETKLKTYWDKKVSTAVANFHEKQLLLNFRP